MTINTLLGTKPLESNDDIVLASIDGQSLSLLSLPVVKRDWIHLLPWVCSNLLYNICLENKNVN